MINFALLSVAFLAFFSSVTAPLPIVEGMTEPTAEFYQVEAPILEKTLFTTPSGAVVDWAGNLISGPTPEFTGLVVPEFGVE